MESTDDDVVVSFSSFDQNKVDGYKAFKDVAEADKYWAVLSAKSVVPEIE